METDRVNEFDLFDTFRVGNLSRLQELAKEDSLNLNEKTKAGWCGLHICAWYGQTQAAQFLLESGARVDEGLPNTGVTALFIACSRGNTDMVSLLLKFSANVNAIFLEGWTPLAIACLKEHTLVVDLLLKNDANVLSLLDNGCSSLYLSAQQRNHDLVRRLLNSDDMKNVDVANRVTGDTALMVAAEVGDDIIVEVLLARGADPNIKNKRGVFPLYIAAQNGHIGICKLLLDKGAEIDEITHANKTSLWASCYFAKIDTAKYLMSRNANTNLSFPILACCKPMASEDHQTTAKSIFWSRRLAITRLLLATKVDLNVSDEKGSPLYHALINQQTEIVIALQESIEGK